MSNGFTPVTLLDPDGNEFVAHSAAEVNNLMYGLGYRPKEKGKSIEDITAAATTSTSTEKSAKKSE